MLFTREQNHSQTFLNHLVRSVGVIDQIGHGSVVNFRLTNRQTRNVVLIFQQQRRADVDRKPGFLIYPLVGDEGNVEFVLILVVVGAVGPAPLHLLPASYPPPQHRPEIATAERIDGEVNGRIEGDEHVADV